MKTQKTCVLVLGMHRSGTSALSGTLSHLGCDLPKRLMADNFANTKGYFESKILKALNDEILEDAGSSWSDWTEFDPEWRHSPAAEAFRARAATALEEEFGPSRFFLLKDPRLCRMLPFWLQALADFDCRPVAILALRHPMDVALSLSRREGMEVEYALLLWLRHVLDAEYQSRAMTRHTTTYDGLKANWADLAQAAEQALGLVWPVPIETAASEIDTFLTPSLSHHNTAADDTAENPLLSVWVRDAYTILNGWATHGENTSDHARLDAIRAELNRATPAFSRLLRLGRGARQAHEISAQALTRAQAAAEDLRHQLAEATRQNDDLVKKVAWLRDVAARKDQDIGALRNSTSWKITRPLRGLARILRRLGAGFTANR